jgi:hypothetical protein
MPVVNSSGSGLLHELYFLPSGSYLSSGIIFLLLQEYTGWRKDLLMLY